MEESWLRLLEEETMLYNHLLLPSQLRLWLPQYLQAWLRFTIAGILLYFITSFLCLDFWKRYFASQDGKYISRQVMVSHINLGMKSIPVFTIMVTGFEYLMLNGWTKCFPRISDVGLAAYCCYVMVYLAIVEVGVYWVHRALHGFKPLYRYVHAIHHRYIKENTISPFAGTAAHPLEVMLLASPNFIATLLVPCHYRTHTVLLLAEAAWSVITHNRSDGQGWPFLGTDYHTIHHTSHHHNLGNFTILMDYLFGTLRHPN